MIQPTRICYGLSIAIIAVSLIVGAVSAYDPKWLSRVELLLYLSPFAAVYLLGRRCYVLWTMKPEARHDWRKEILWFLLLYVSVVVGFASIFYSIREDFEIGTTDPALEELKKNLRDFEAKVPEVQESAKREYERWQKITGAIETNKVFIERAFQGQRERFGPKPGPMWTPPEVFDLYEEIKQLEAELATVNVALVNEYKGYLTAKARGEAAKAEIIRYPYLNFVYFSTVTIATVGYGDIVPKRIRAKMVVISEILLAAGLILVYLNLVVGARRT